MGNFFKYGMGQEVFVDGKVLKVVTRISNANGLSYELLNESTQDSTIAHEDEIMEYLGE